MTIRRLVPLRHCLLPLAVLLLGQSALAPTALAAPAQQAARSSIKDVALTTGDVAKIYGSGLKLFLSQVISNKDAAKDAKLAGKAASMTSLGLKGRVTGYDADWARIQGNRIVSITNIVSQYSSDSYAQNALGLAQEEVRKGQHGVQYHLLSYGGVGDEVLAASAKIAGLTTYLIVFRRGAYLAVVGGGMKPGTIKLSDLGRLAGIEDQRIQAHG